jgi:6-phosphogluconolactonase
MPTQRKGGFFTYVSMAGEHEIVVFRLTSTDKAPEILQRVPILPEVKKGGMSTPMALSPDGAFLHVALRNKPLPLVTFAIDRKTGLLAEAGVARLPASTPHVNVDPNGRVLVTVANPGATVAVSQIKRDGPPRNYASEVVHVGHKVHASVAGKDGRHLYVSSTDDKQIFQFRLRSKNARLSPLKPPFVTLREGGDPRHMVVSPSGRHLYTVTEAGGRVVCFAIDPKSGALSEQFDVALMPASFTEDPESADIHMSPNGRLLYASVRSADTIVGFEVNPRTGALTLIDRWKTERVPRAFAITPDGRSMLVAGEKSGTLGAYAIDRKTGALSKGFEMPVGDRPNWICFLK